MKNFARQARVLPHVLQALHCKAFTEVVTFIFALKVFFMSQQMALHVNLNAKTKGRNIIVKFTIYSKLKNAFDSDFGPNFLGLISELGTLNNPMIGGKSPILKKNLEVLVLVCCRT